MSGRVRVRVSGHVLFRQKECAKPPCAKLVHLGLRRGWRCRLRLKQLLQLAQQLGQAGHYVWEAGAGLQHAWEWLGMGAAVHKGSFLCLLHCRVPRVTWNRASQCELKCTYETWGKVPLWLSFQPPFLHAPSKPSLNQALTFGSSERHIVTRSCHSAPYKGDRREFLTILKAHRVFCQATAGQEYAHGQHTRSQPAAVCSTALPCPYLGSESGK